MEVEEFFAQYRNLAGKIEELKEKKQISSLNDELSLRLRIQKLESMLGILRGLESNNSHEALDSRKPAHYFVSAITDDDIVRSDKPLLQLPCPKCKTSHHVLMSYERVFNDGEIGVWEKDAFIICPDCCETYELKNYLAAQEF